MLWHNRWNNLKKWKCNITNKIRYLSYNFSMHACVQLLHQGCHQYNHSLKHRRSIQTICKGRRTWSPGVGCISTSKCIQSYELKPSRTWWLRRGKLDGLKDQKMCSRTWWLRRGNSARRQEPVGNTDDFRIFQENFKKKESFRRFPGQQRYDPSR
jgi:hypothetical protein